MLCIITVYLCDIYYITGCVDLLISFSCFLSPTQSPLPLGNYPFFSVFVLFYSFFLIPHISEMMWYLSFCVWLISLSIILSRSIHVVTNGKISFLWLSNIQKQRHYFANGPARFQTTRVAGGHAPWRGSCFFFRYVPLCLLRLHIPCEATCGKRKENMSVQK